MPNYVAVCIPKAVLELKGIDHTQIELENWEVHHEQLIFQPVEATSAELALIAISVTQPQIHVLHIRTEENGQDK